jgi:hypothetical protein
VALILRLARENPRWGLPAHPRRAQEARGLGVGDHHPPGATGQRASTRAATVVHDVAGIPSSTGHRHHRDRLLHRRDGAPQNPLHLVLHRVGTRRVRLGGVTDHLSGLWMVQRAREFSMEMETDRRGTGACLGSSSVTTTASSPRLRRRVRLRRDPDHPDTHPGAKCQLLR